MSFTPDSRHRHSAVSHRGSRPSACICIWLLGRSAGTACWLAGRGCCDIETPRGLNRRLFTPTVASPPSNRLARHTHSSTALHEGAATALWRSSKTRQKRIQFRQSPRVFPPPIPVLISARPARPHPRDFRRRHKGIADSIFLDQQVFASSNFPCYSGRLPMSRKRVAHIRTKNQDFCLSIRVSLTNRLFAYMRSARSSMRAAPPQI